MYIVKLFIFSQKSAELRRGSVNLSRSEDNLCDPETKKMKREFEEEDDITSSGDPFYQCLVKLLACSDSKVRSDLFLERNYKSLWRAVKTAKDQNNDELPVKMYIIVSHLLFLALAMYRDRVEVS